MWPGSNTIFDYFRVFSPMQINLNKRWFRWVMGLISELRSGKWYRTDPIIQEFCCVEGAAWDAMF